jgi:uncharacterized protein YndB with AHSA1/START domain
VCGVILTREKEVRVFMTEATNVTRKAERELVVTRAFNAPVQSVFDAWTKPALLKQWWAPKSSGTELVSCVVDARAGGSYRFEFGDGGARTMAFFGKYIEAVSPSRLVWTNEESEDGALTTLTLEEKGGSTHLTLTERYPSQDARELSFEGMEACMPEQFAQLDELLKMRGLE